MMLGLSVCFGWEGEGGVVGEQALGDFKTSTILVYMIINGKGSSNWLTWVQHVPVPFYRSIQYSRVVKSNSFAHLFPVL